MVMTDPIADMLTRIRNANQAKLPLAKMPSSKVKTAIAKILKENGYINEFKVTGEVKKELSVKLKYKGSVSAINGLKRISKPGLRVTVSADKMPKVLNGLGTAIVSTSKGIMTSKEAKAQNLGGEVLAYV
jgi:small subunit ribosomal protein S8